MASDDFLEGENNEADSAFWLRNSGAHRNPRTYQCLGSRRKRQELPPGATMPLGKLQEDMHVGESLPINAERERKAATTPVAAALLALE
jgi:hypothetical protein